MTSLIDRPPVEPLLDAPDPGLEPIRYASTFTGIGGFELGFAQAGMTPTVMVEVDPKASKVLDHHFPAVPKAGDISDVSGSDLGRPHITVGGFPCGDTSIAAPHRLGLAGERSGLYREILRLQDEHFRLTQDCEAEWCVLENVPGILRSNGGRDMVAVVRGLEQLGMQWAYRLVDSAYLGSAQRRPRVLVVGHRGDDPSIPREVLGLTGDGSEAAEARPVRRSPRRPAPVVDPAGDDGVLIWRKSARARASLDKGGYETWVPLDEHESGNTLTGFDGGGPARQTHLVQQGGRLRTLTLTEWERLSGVPDGWTDMIPEAARYTALGNIAHPAMTGWLGRRLAAVHRSLHPQKAA